MAGKANKMKVITDFSLTGRRISTSTGRQSFSGAQSKSARNSTLPPVPSSRDRVKSEAEVQLYWKGHKREEEKKQDAHEAKQMFAHYEKVEQGYRAREEVKRTELCKAQEQNVRVAMIKKNSDEQHRVGDSLKEKALIDSGAFENKNADTR